MIRIGKWITKHKNIILILTVLLLIPAAFGYVSTRVNYDVLSYLPESLETVKGQDIMVDEFGMGAFSMIIVEDMDMKDAVKLENKLEKIDHVKDVLFYDDALDISVPTEMIPEDLRKAFFNGDAKMMIAFLTIQRHQQMKQWERSKRSVLPYHRMCTPAECPVS